MKMCSLDISLKVTDVDKAYFGAIERGGIPIAEPWVEKDESGYVKKAVIGTYVDTIHTLVECEEYKGFFLPGYEPYDGPNFSASTGIVGIE